ncbi:connector enhancer of kinase suppressor of ras 1 [Engraulis encrasicolus]|uniref:connector enhancer of kinase suppressor of ras 1 n=1 Tax=Engraulis encrasicolus TaxID=184585 RepID=UPI002FCFBDB2
MEPITSWSPKRVSEWLKGLEAPLQRYPFSEWRVSGMDLLQMTSTELELLGVHKIGHQELILEAVEKLCALMYGLGGESLRGLTEKLRGVAHHLQKSIQGRWSLRSLDHSATKLPSNELQEVLDLITSAKGLFSLLNRYQFSQLSGFTASKNIITLCRDLGTIVHKDIGTYEKEKDIISICRQLEAVCDDILSGSPDALLSHTTRLESVDLVPTAPGDQLGIEIISTGCSNHYVTGTLTESPAEFCEKILAGDEVVQVNDQIVVGWSRKNLVKKLQENPNGVTLVLKKVPVSIKRKEKPPEIEVEEEEEEKKEEEDSEESEDDEKRHSIFERVAASVRSLSFRSAIRGPEALQLMGQQGQEASDNPSHTSVDDKGTSNHKGAESEDLEVSGLSVGGLEVDPALDRRSPSPCPSPRALEVSRSSISSCPEMGGQREERDSKKSSVKGKTTAMSRRRVSCRELGRPDCDGWLWKKRKETGMFMTQKWQRFWFVLKGNTLYWYNSQQEVKADGLVQVGSYSIESAGEHKRKYVFKMCHQRFQNFFFAADNVTDMSKWINSLISAIQKHKKLHKDQPDSEEECYSETESEDEDTGSPRLHKKKNYTKAQSNTLPRTRARKDRSSAGGTGTVTGTPTQGRKGASEDEMGVLFHRLKEGGVSLIGQDQPFTHDHFRKSFIRRNKNPVINEKAHQLRALHSTLKAKEAELLVLNRILDDSELTAEKFREWKHSNEELVLEIERLAAEKERIQQAASEEVAKAATGNQDTGEAGQEVAEAEQQHECADASFSSSVSERLSDAYVLRLSLGEELVDADINVSLDTTTASMETTSTTETSLDTAQTELSVDPLNLSSASSDGYFYI